MINNKELSIIVKKRRKELKMSQVELAKGICTQGTISNIEKHRGLPSTNIISELADRLGIQIDVFEVVKEEQQSIESLLKQASKLCAHGENVKAYYQLREVMHLKNTLEDADKKKYCYYLGTCYYSVFSDSVEAEHIFSEAIDDLKKANDIEDVLLFLGMGIVNFENGNKEEAFKWFENCLVALRKDSFSVKYNTRELLKIYYHLAKYYSLNLDYLKSIELCDIGLYWANELDSTYYLGHLLYEKGYNLVKLDELSEGRLYYNMALAQSVVCRYDALQTLIRRDSEKFKLSLFY